MRWQIILLLVAVCGLQGRADEPAAVRVALDLQQPVATTFGFHKYPEGAIVSGPDLNLKMSYLMFLPHGYVETGKPTALFIFLHGTSHQGSDLHGILNEGPANFMERNPGLKEEFPMVCLFPQCPAHLRWDTPGMAQATVALIEQVSKAYRIDRDRVYLTGLSMGGEGTWLVAEADPDRFAAIAPISAIAVDPEKAIGEFGHLAIWIICGSEDGAFTAGSKMMDAALKKAGIVHELTVVPNEGHGCWNNFYPDPHFYLSLMQYRRTSQPTH